MNGLYCLSVFRNVGIILVRSATTSIEYSNFPKVRIRGRSSRLESEPPDTVAKRRNNMLMPCRPLSEDVTRQNNSIRTHSVCKIYIICFFFWFLNSRDQPIVHTTQL